MWAIVGLIARVAPVSFIPLLLNFYDHAEVDRIVIVQANATLVAVIAGFAQGNFIQQNYKEFNISSLILFSSIVPIIILIIIYLFLLFFVGVQDIFLLSGILGLAMSYVPQAQAILKCSNAYRTAITADLARIALYSIFALWLPAFGKIAIDTAVLIMALFYVLPYLAFFFKNVRSVTFAEIPPVWWTTLPYLTVITSSALLSAATLSALRYIILFYGEQGDLALYAALYSVASLSVVTVDFLYVRVGQDIVTAARDRNDVALLAVAKRIIVPVGAISALSLVVTLAYAAILAPKGHDAMLAATIIVASFTLRSIYVFFQNILIGLKTARYDFIASSLAMGTTVVMGPALVNWWPVVGAAIVFFLVCFTYVISLGTIVKSMRKDP
jgi:O-antigen/teichoic acid export membrane protein